MANTNKLLGNTKFETRKNDTWYAAIREGRATVQVFGSVYGHRREAATAEEAAACVASGHCVLVTRRVSPARLTGAPVGSVRV